MTGLLDIDGHSLDWVRMVVLLVPAAPALATALLAALVMLGRPLTERETVTITGVGVVTSLLAALLTTGVFIARDASAIELHAGNFFEVHGYAFEIELLVDRLSIAMVLTTGIVTALVMRFSVRYLHRDPGFVRFFALLGVFASGMQLLVLAGSYDLLFVGWEMVGLSSFLLVTFFQFRDGPARGGLRAFVTYRITDVGLLVAGVLLHQATGSSELEAAFGQGAWPHATTHLEPAVTTPIALALLLSVIGKSALFPASGWLPRAMEGPTPSSALFYGALSVHAGIYLLLRTAPLLESTDVGAGAVMLIGALTVITSTFAGRAQSDIKSAIAYATSSQVGLMAFAVGLAAWLESGGLAMLVVAYMVAHACLRTLQLLRAPSALRDAQEIAAALPELKPTARPVSRVVPDDLGARFYRLSLHRFYLDELLDRFLISPVLALAVGADRLERRWLALLAGWSGLEGEPRDDEVAEEVGETVPRTASTTHEKGGHA